MPIDGVVVRNIVKELNDKLINGKIDKVTQPEIDEIILGVRNNGKNYKLLLSSSASYPRVHLTDIHKQSPITPPMFCMVLRKHLLGGKIIGVEQYGLDRIIKIHIEAYDELGNLSTKALICEIMGRHSNIILVNQSTNTIIDSIKHITAEISSYRLVLPGVTYKYPPYQNKIDILNFNYPLFLDRVKSSGKKLIKAIPEIIEGISVISAKEICFNGKLSEDVMSNTLNDMELDRLKNSLYNFIDSIIRNEFTPVIYCDEAIVHDFYCLKLNHLKFMDIEIKESISKAIEAFYYKKDSIDRLKQKSSDILKIITTNLDRCLKKLGIQEERLRECQEKDKWRLYGDLIMTNLYNIQKGDSKAIVQNFYDENLGKIEIPLDMTLSPVENAQSYYKKYNKDKNAEIAILKQKEENLSEIEYLENQLLNLNNCTEEEEIEEIRNELIAMNYIKKGKKKTSKQTKQSKPMHYISSDGTDIYIGKNNVQNDYLTTKFAEPNDIWMHTKNIPGSHVIVKSNGKSISESALLEAANLAAYYSKGRNSSNVPVDYTERKNVKKPSGAKPGMVIYYTNKTIYITPNENIIKNMNMANR